jgi:hypothetical protein
MRAPTQILSSLVNRGLPATAPADERAAPDQILAASLPADDRDELRIPRHDNCVAIRFSRRHKTGVESVETFVGGHGQFITPLYYASFALLCGMLGLPSANIPFSMAARLESGQFRRLKWRVELGKCPRLRSKPRAHFAILTSSMVANPNNQAVHIRGSLGFPDVIGGEESFLGETSRGGAGFCREAPLSVIDQSGCSRKFSEIGRFGTCLARMRPRCSGRGLLRCDKPGTLQKSRAKTGYAARYQYGLQIAEGMVTFFESYERELEKHWTKTLFFQFS